nr:hypothetical protein GCM10020093_094780 [Planobispora longispora]
MGLRLGRAGGPRRRADRRGRHLLRGRRPEGHGHPSDDPRVRERAAQIPDFHWKGLLRDPDALPAKPIVCAVEGYAVAGGTELLVGTDLRVVAESATLGLFEARRALFPMGGSAIRLPARSPTPSPWTCC